AAPAGLPMEAPGSPVGGGIPNHSRLIPGSPALPNMTAGHSPGMMGGMGNPAGSSLLGREVSPAPLSPMTQPLAAASGPSLSLGGSGDMPASPIPAGRSIPHLRAPRGTNFIRLAFAAVFLLGFLGLVGFLLKDYLPGVIPGLAANVDTEETSAPGASIPALPSASAPKSNITETVSEGGPSKSTASVVAESQTKPIVIGFDPAEPAPSGTQMTTTAEAASSDVTGSSKTALVAAVPVDSAPEVATPGGSLLEVPSKQTMASTLAAPPAVEPGATPPAPAVTEEDTPAEARPAVDALKKFLFATSLADRLQHTLGAEHMKPLMERYYTRSPDGPVLVDRIQFVRMDPNPELGSGKHCIFSLENKTWEFPVPVMLEEQPEGFKVDWLAFVEFKDRLLEKFFQGYQEGPARFHVGIIRQHYFEDDVPNIDTKDAFRVMPAPPNSYQASVFINKDTQLAQQLRNRLPWETHVWAVVELEWKKLGSQQWVELSAVPQMHWYSLPMSKPISAPQKASQENDMPPGISKNGKGNARPAGSATNNGATMPPTGIRKSTPDLPQTIRRPLPAGR
ncbi:MAG: hypothetical protein IAE77_15775, partial [Prosthecobacter sp.]